MNRLILFYVPSGQPEIHSKSIEVDIDVPLRDIVPLVYKRFKFGWFGIELRYKETVLAFTKM
jgi:hypothetical protein